MPGKSRLPAKDKCNNKLIPGAVYGAPNIYFSAEKSPGKPQLGDRRLYLCDQLFAQMGPLPPNEVGEDRTALQEGRRKGLCTKRQQCFYSTVKPTLRRVSSFMY